MSNDLSNIINDMRQEDRIKKYNVCGRNHYINSDVNGVFSCNECDGTETGNLALQCNDSISTWLPAQFAINPDKRNMDGSDLWTNINTVLVGNDDNIDSNDRGNIEDTIRSWYVSRLTRNELNDKMTESNWTKYDDRPLNERINLFKEEVSSSRGSNIFCIEPNNDGEIVPFDGGPSINLGSNFDISEWNSMGGCDDSGTFGPKHIILEEVNHWKLGGPYSESGSMNNEINGEVTHGEVTHGPGEHLMSPNREFEGCINSLLHEQDNYNDKLMIEEIKQMNDITSLKKEHILFIKKKLELLITPSKRGDIKVCIEKHIHADSYTCKTGLAEQMLLILKVLFSTIGLEMNIDSLDNKNVEKKDKLIEIIDNLGDLIPKVLERIIHISEDIEISKCGNITNKTIVLKELYNKTFQPEKRHTRIDMKLPDILSTSETSDDEYKRTIGLGALILGALKYF